MRKTNLQNIIEHATHVVSMNDSNSTIMCSKQAVYNRLFHANNFSVPELDCNIQYNKYELLTMYHVHVAITRHLLKNLMSSGNLAAMELLNGINHTVCIEDLEQEILLKFMELDEHWTIDNTGKVEFDSDNTMKEIFGTVSRYLYQFQTKHYKHLYIEIDGDIVDATKVTALADYVCIDNILADEHIHGFLEKQTEHDKQWFLYRMDGLSNKAIADIMKVTYEKIRATEKRVRKNWEKWDKGE